MLLDMFKFWNDRDNKGKNQLIYTSPVAPMHDDGAHEYEISKHEDNVSDYGGGVHHRIYNQNLNINNVKQLINTYRTLLNNYEVDNAVREIVSDAIVYEENHDVVTLDLSKSNFSENLKKKIQNEFNEVLSLLNFERKGAELFRRWYIDSRIIYHKVIDEKNPKQGIKELRRLDVRETQFIREVITDVDNGVKVVVGHKEFFNYNTGITGYSYLGSFYSPNSIVSIPASAITYVHSGLIDCNHNIIGYLHRAIKPANQLKLLEDAMVIYRLTRAPDRRVFYIDTGNMPSRKAAQHMQSIMNTMRNRVVYDAATGQINNQKHNMSLTEDYWLQRRDGKAVTEVDTLPGMQGMNEMDDVRYFRKSLYMALGVPLSRIPDEQNTSPMFDSGTQITRDELRFAGLIKELQHKFAEIMLDPLKTNLILKGIITDDEWDENINNFNVVFHKNSYFTEMKDAEIQERRLNILQQIEPYIGKYVSHEYVMKHLLQMDESAIEGEKEKIEQEQNDPRFNNKPDEDF